MVLTPISSLSSTIWSRISLYLALMLSRISDFCLCYCLLFCLLFRTFLSLVWLFWRKIRWCSEEELLLIWALAFARSRWSLICRLLFFELELARMGLGWNSPLLYSSSYLRDSGRGVLIDCCMFWLDGMYFSRLLTHCWIFLPIIWPCLLIFCCICLCCLKSYCSLWTSCKICILFTCC